MSSDRIDVRHVAKLARLALTEAEVAQFGAQLSGLLTFVDELGELDTAHIGPTAGVVETRNVTRADELRPCLSHADAMAAAPAEQSGFFRVPKIIAAAD